MARSSFLSFTKQHEVLLRWNNGEIIVDIVVVIKHIQTVVKNVLADVIGYGCNKFVRRPKQITDRDVTRVHALLQENQIFVSVSISQLQQPVSSAAAYRVLRHVDKLCYSKIKRTLLLYYGHRKCKMDCTIQHVHWNMQSKYVVFTDEKGLNMDGLYGAKYCWRDKDASFQTCAKLDSDGGSLMIQSGAFCANKK